MAYNRPNSNDIMMRHRRGRQLLRKKQGTHGQYAVPRWLIALVGIGGLAFVAMIVAGVAGMLVYQDYADGLVPPDELAINQPSYGAKILDRTGKLLYEYVDDRSGLRRPINLDQVAPAFLAATVNTEDSSFFTNPGVNVKGLGRAAWENLSPFSDTPGVLTGSGGSSITQQLVKNVYIPEKERQQRSADRKIKEIIYALELSTRYDKEKILGWYVNQISYGGVYNGIEAASQGYFGKPASELTLGEAALIAGIPQSPAAYDPVNHPEAAIARRSQILDLLERKGRVQIGDNKFFTVTPEEIAAARVEPLNIAVKRFPIEAPHFVLEYIQPQLENLFGHEALLRDGLVVQTTLDIDLQHQVQDVMEKWISQNEAATNSHNGAMMVMDPKKGEILTMIGSRDYFNDNIEGKNNNATSCNSPGSSFKPFAYLASFISLGWGPGTVILDTPVSYKQNDGSEFRPVNPDKQYHGPVSIRNALGNSYNIPAVKMAAAVGPDKIVQQAMKMGFMNTFRLTSNGGCAPGYGYGPAIATGGIGVTLEEMMFGYTVFANAGILRGQVPFVAHNPGERQVDPISILKVTDAKNQVLYDSEKSRKEVRVLGADYAYLITDILTDPQAQCVDFGCGGLSVPGYKVAVKTGASQPYPDGPLAEKTGETWTFGYTPDVVVGIWAGNSDNTPLSNLLSTTIAFKSVRDTIPLFYGDRPETPFVRPDTIVSGSVCAISGLRATPSCPKVNSDIYVKDQLPSKEDDWWRPVNIDIRNGLLAGPATPPQYIQQQVMLVLPPEMQKSEQDRAAAEAWAKALGVTIAPTETSNGQPGPGGLPGADLPATIFTPLAGSTVSGVVPIQGRASTAAFQFYRLEIGAGTTPITWTLIGQNFSRVEDGMLGNWVTTGLPTGLYTIRLTVIDSQRGPLTATSQVNLGPAGAGGAPTAPPTTAPPGQPPTGPTANPLPTPTNPALRP